MIRVVALPDRNRASQKRLREMFQSRAFSSHLPPSEGSTLISREPKAATSVVKSIGIVKLSERHRARLEPAIEHVGHAAAGEVKVKSARSNRAESAIRVLNQPRVWATYKCRRARGPASS